MPPHLAEELRARIHAHNLGKFEAQILQLARAAIEFFVEESEAKLGEARFSGAPDLPPSIAWPRNEHGQYFSFLLQINLAQVPHFEGSPLPTRGMLWFFVGQNEPAYDIAHRVLFYAGSETLQPTISPHDEEFWSDHFLDLIPRRLTPHLRLQEPQWYSHEYSQLELDDEEFDCYNKMQDRENYLLAVLLGGVRGIGDEPREDAFTTREPDSPKSNYPFSSKGDKAAMLKWQNLLWLNSTREGDFCIWDAGYFNFLIHQDDLKTWDFERLYVEIQSS